MVTNLEDSAVELSNALTDDAVAAEEAAAAIIFERGGVGWGEGIADGFS